MTRHKALACWRLRVWEKRLSRRREAWSRMEAYALPGDPLLAEDRVTQALAKRVKWRKRCCANCRGRLLRSLV